MKKRILSILLSLAMTLSLLPSLAAPAAAAEGTDGKNISNTSTDTFETLGFNTDASELQTDATPGKSPTGTGSFAIRTISELLLSGKGWNSDDIEDWNSSLKSNLGYGLYDYDSSAVNFNSKYSGYMYNLRKRTDASAYTGGSLPTDYNFVKTLAFDPTGSGKDDFVAYLYAEYTWAPKATFTLYVASKDGVVSSVYNLGTAPFLLLTHQADAYMPLAAGDYDGDGKDELAAYCFGDSTKSAQWGSSTDTTKPYYKTNTDGNLVDNQNRRINADGYLIDGTTGLRIDANGKLISSDGYLIDSATGLRIDASGKLIAADGYLIDSTTQLRINEAGYLINAEGYLVATKDGGQTYTYIDADGADLSDQNVETLRVIGTPVVGVPVQGVPVLGEPVGYRASPVDDENLDVRVLDVGVTKSSDTVTGIALTRATRSAADGSSIDIEYDLTNLGFSKGSVLNNNDAQLANKKCYPIVDLSTIEQPGDEYDDLMLCVSHANFSVTTTAEAATRMVFWIDPGSATGTKTQTAAGVWNQSTDYGTGNPNYAEMMAFGGASQANLDGDADGYNEVVVAGYRYANTNLNVRLSSLDATPSGDDNPFKMDDADSDNINYYLAATYSYDTATRSYVSDGPATWIFVDDDEYNDSTNLREEIYDGNTIRDIVFTPLEVLGFAEKGSGYADSVFVNGFVCDYYLSESGGGVSTLPYGPKELKNSACSQREGNFLFVSYAIPTSYILVENDPSRDGKATTHQRWIGDAVAGNFDGDASGVEELYCTYMRNRNAMGYDETSATLLAVQKKKPGKLSSTSDLYDGDLKINDDSSIYDEHNTVGSKNYSFSGNDLWQAEEGRSFALSAPDWDNDSLIARPSNTKNPEYYFSDPYVIAVLQSAPYFEELSADYDFYPSNGSTAIEKEEGTTHSGSAGFEVSAGYIVGDQGEVPLVGSTAGAWEEKLTVSVNMSMEYSHESTKSYSTAFTAMVGTDMVALTMTPYVRYYYDVYNPETHDWAAGNMTLDMPKTPRTSMVSVETYDRVAQYSGWENIRNNILSNTPGDPYSYATTSSGLSDFEGGKTTMGSSGNNWVGVGTGGTSSVGNITQAISSETTNGFNVSIGASVEIESTTTIGTAINGFTANAGVTAGYGYATFTGMSFSGTVDNLPQDAADGYDFLWRFGCWKDSLSYTTSSGKTDSNSVYVLGYLVKDVESQPKPPQDLAVVDFTENSITLEWSHPNVVPVSYIIYREETGGLVPLQIVQADTRSGKATQQYVDTTCEPGTEYSYVIASVRYVNGFERKGPNSPTATGKTLSSDVPKVIISPLHPTVQSGDNVTLTATVTAVPGGSAPTVQWQKWNGERYVNIDGESDLTYKMNSVTDDMSGSRYRCYAIQYVNGKWKAGYSVYSELTVTKRESATTLADVDARYALDGTVNLGADVKDVGKGTAITDGSVVFSIINTSTGGVWNLKSSLNNSGRADSTFSPGLAGIYAVTARYLGTTIYAGSESAEKSFLVYSTEGNVLVIDSESEMTYGDTLSLAAKLVGIDGTEDIVSAAYKVTDEDVFNALTTSVPIVGTTFNPITSSKDLFSLRNGQARGYNDACGNYIIQATYTVGGTTYYATKLVTVKPATLKITVGDETIDGFSSKTLDAAYLKDVAVTYNGFVTADDETTQANYKALFEVYTDTAYSDLYVGDHIIKLRYRDATTSGLTNYDVTLAQLLKNYNVLCKNGTLFVTDNWYTVTYSVTDGEGSLDARTVSRATLASSARVLKNTPLTFAAAPAAGYEVQSWNFEGSDLADNASLLSVGSAASSKSGKITDDTTVAVTFGVSYPELSWSVTDGKGSLTPSISATSPANVIATGTYTFTARPDSGYMVDEWTVKGVVSRNSDGSVYRAATLTLDGLDGDTAVTVKFTPSVYYTVSAAGMDAAGNALGSVTVSPKTGSLLAGTALTFTANAPSGYIIREWRQYTDATHFTVLQYNVPSWSIASLAGSTDIRVVFAPAVKYKLSFGVNGPAMGTITAESAGTALTSGGSYFAGIPVTFTVTAIDGYRIASVTTDDTSHPTLTPLSTAANGVKTYSMTLSRAVTVTANFVGAGDKHTVTVQNGTVGGGTTGSFYQDDTVAITADSAPAGKVFSGWTSADGVAFANAASTATTFIMPNKAVTVTANYSVAGGGGAGGGGGGGGGSSETAKVALRFEPNGGSAIGPVSTDKDTVVDLTAYRPTLAGHTFAGWYSDSALTKPVTSVTLTDDMTVYAKWTVLSIKYLNTDDHVAYLAGYDTGEFGPDRNMTRAEAAMMFYRLLRDRSTAETKSFPDVDADAWYGAAVEKLAGLGIASGYSDGSFKPGNPITRAEFVTMASRFTELDDTDCSFNDVSIDYWAYHYISFAAGQGWVSGYPDGSFGPEKNITRAEVTKIVNKLLGRTADSAYADSHSIRAFPDVEKTNWAYYEIAEAANAHDYTKDDSGAETWTKLK